MTVQNKERLGFSSILSKLLLNDGKVDRYFYDLVYAHSFFFFYFRSSVPSFHSHHHFCGAIRRTLIAWSRSWNQREKWFCDFPRLHHFQLRHDGVLFLFYQLFFLLVRYYSPFFHRPQSFSATFRFASQRRYKEKCNKWFLFVKRHK